MHASAGGDAGLGLDTSNQAVPVAPLHLSPRPSPLTSIMRVSCQASPLTGGTACSRGGDEG